MAAPYEVSKPFNPLYGVDEQSEAESVNVCLIPWIRDRRTGALSFALQETAQRTSSVASLRNNGPVDSICKYLLSFSSAIRKS